MKKIVSVFIVGCIILLMVAGIAVAEMDFSGMSFDELIAAREQITMALWDSDGWQEVEVPAGVYKIGVDIPAGHWTIKPAVADTMTVNYGNNYSQNELQYPYSYQQISHPDDSYYKYNPVSEISWELEDGYYLIIEDGPVIFTPYVGATLNFK